MKLYNLGTSQIGFVELYAIGETIELDEAQLEDARKNNGVFLLSETQWNRAGFTAEELLQFSYPAGRSFDEAEEQADPIKKEFMRKYRAALVMAHDPKTTDKTTDEVNI